MDTNQFGGNLRSSPRPTKGRPMSYRRRTTYNVKGPLSARGVGPGTAAVFGAVNLALAIWVIYFLITVASFVNAWPF